MNSLSGYSTAFFKDDLRAGLTVSILLIPQVMAYAILAGMPPIYGLYGALVPLIVYGFLGSSTRLSIGPVAISSLLILSGVSTMAQPESEMYIQYVLTLGLMVGVIQLLMGLFRFGFLVNFLSHPVISGFISAAAIIIMISQLKDFLGIAIPLGGSTISTLRRCIASLSEFNLPTLVIGITSLMALIIIKRIKKQFPTALLLVIIGTGLCYALNWSNIGVAEIGEIPRGLPTFYVPIINLEMLESLLPTALSIALIGIIGSIGIGKYLEAKHKDHSLNPNQELIALGASKIFGVFGQALPATGSFGRTAINSDQEAKTQISNLVAVMIVILTLLFLTPLFYHMPKAILAAIIFHAVMGLIDFTSAKHLWKVHKWEFIMWLSTFIITLLIGIQQGVITGVTLSLLAVLYRSSKPKISILGHVPGTTYYRNLDRFEDARSIDNILILRFDNALYFGNSNFFKDKIISLLRAQPKVHNVILDASPINHIDSSAITMLRELDNELQSRDIHLYLCGAVGSLRDILSKENLMTEPDKHHMDVHSAVQFIKENIISEHHIKARQSNQ